LEVIAFLILEAVALMIFRGGREVMMHKLEKSPGMFSDRPGTTPKSLDLVVSLTCLREKEKERAFGCCLRFGGGE
jgi:hypothetical protein